MKANISGVNVTRKYLDDNGIIDIKEKDGWGLFLTQTGTVLVPIGDLKKNGVSHYVDMFKEFNDIPCTCSLPNKNI